MFLVALGCIWVLQGLGWLAWPADSFMLGERTWALRGALAIGLGFVVLGLAVRRRRD